MLTPNFWSWHEKNSGHVLVTCPRFFSRKQMKSQKVFNCACSIYILSLLIVLPFMTWKDTAYVVAIALIGYGLGKWKGKAYEAHILPLAVAYLAAKPFLHYGPYPTDWSWQRYVILGETVALGVLFLATRSWARIWPCSHSQKDPIRLFPVAIIFAFAGLIGTCAVPYVFGRRLTEDLLPLVLAVVCLAVLYPVFVRCFGAARERQSRGAVLES